MSYHYDKDIKQYVLSRQGSTNDLHTSKSTFDDACKINHSPQIMRVVSRSRMASMEEIAHEVEIIKASVQHGSQKPNIPQTMTPVRQPFQERHSVAKPMTSFTPSTTNPQKYFYDSSLQNSRAETPIKQNSDSFSSCRPVINSVRLSDDWSSQHSGIRSRVRLITAGSRESSVKNVQQAPEAAKPNLQQKQNQTRIVEPTKQVFQPARKQLQIRREVVKQPTSNTVQKNIQSTIKQPSSQPSIQPIPQQQTRPQHTVKQSKIQPINDKKTIEPQKISRYPTNILQKYKIIEPTRHTYTSDIKPFFSSNHVKQQPTKTQQITHQIIHASCNTDPLVCQQCLKLKQLLSKQLQIKQQTIQQKSLEINNLQKLLKNAKIQQSEADRFRQIIHQIISEHHRPCQPSDIVHQLRSVMSELQSQHKELTRCQASLHRAHTELNQVKQHNFNTAFQSQKTISKLQEQLYVLDHQYAKLEGENKMERGMRLDVEKLNKQLSQQISQLNEKISRQEKQFQEQQVQLQKAQQVQQTQQVPPAHHQIPQPPSPSQLLHLQQQLELQKQKSEQYLSDFNSLLSFYRQRIKQLEDAETLQQIQQLKHKQRISQLQAKIQTFQMQLQQIQQQDAGLVRTLKRQLIETRNKFNSNLTDINQDSLKEYIKEVRTLNDKLNQRDQQIFQLKTKALESDGKATQFKNQIQLERTKAVQSRSAMEAQHQQQLHQLYQKLYERQRMVDSLMDKLGLVATEGKWHCSTSPSESVNLVESIQKDFKRMRELEHNNRMLTRQLNRLSGCK